MIHASQGCSIDEVLAEGRKLFLFRVRVRRPLPLDSDGSVATRLIVSFILFSRGDQIRI
jgi:hypothetical protein